MKVLLRNRCSNSYLEGNGRWTGKRERARDFERGAYAILFVVHHRLPDLEAVLDFGDPRFDLVFPIHLPPAEATAESSGGPGAQETNPTVEDHGEGGNSNPTARFDHLSGYS